MKNCSISSSFFSISNLVSEAGFPHERGLAQHGGGGHQGTGWLRYLHKGAFLRKGGNHLFCLPGPLNSQLQLPNFSSSLCSNPDEMVQEGSFSSSSSTPCCWTPPDLEPNSAVSSPVTCPKLIPSLTTWDPSMAAQCPQDQVLSLQGSWPWPCSLLGPSAPGQAWSSGYILQALRESLWLPTPELFAYAVPQPECCAHPS